jgi:hypothetical protein
VHAALPDILDVDGDESHVTDLSGKLSGKLPAFGFLISGSTPSRRCSQRPDLEIGMVYERFDKSLSDHPRRTKNCSSQFSH